MIPAGTVPKKDNQSPSFFSRGLNEGDLFFQFKGKKSILNNYLYWTIIFLVSTCEPAFNW